ncbi:Gfo/Idh/MocA family protein [Sulfuriroseicoccus oceanibius]|uniref:Gfo/Idh/MocA family oxidoreductase n=1 Tax=Sulfuriroseicoccus oceanibius TaxID=2707525 RepID=A0A6B3LB78_9BACT|nr:Gfo/Idh/MocA family oxidoreductase [Sulfuriroseicoccus oceanibius]QQL43996.1 Gfo/Idh/MocA family oxidoreductase [Sulfuriroseicoccus oceanibius]
MIRLGVVGVGGIGRNHARILAELDDVEVGGIYDADQERCKAVAAEFGVPALDSLEALIESVDAASVATPTIYHREVGEALLNAGKHVLIEKPIAPTLDDSRALVDLAKEKNLILQVGHIERFNPVMGELERKLSDAKFIEAHRLSPFPNRSVDIGVILDLMIHDIEIVLHLVKSPVVSIDAVGVPVLTQREDIANARLRFENGCVANITASRISPERLRKIRVFQGDGYLSLDYQAQAGEIYSKDGMEITRESVAVEKDEPLKLELAHFADCARHGRQPKVTGQEGMAALDLALEITEMVQNGGGQRILQA